MRTSWLPNTLRGKYQGQYLATVPPSTNWRLEIPSFGPFWGPFTTEPGLGGEDVLEKVGSFFCPSLPKPQGQSPLRQREGPGRVLDSPGIFR